MKTLLGFAVFLLLTGAVLYGSGCAIFASCSDHGISGTQTGNVRYTPNGCIIAEYHHAGNLSGTIPAHRYWQACDCE